MKLLCFIVISVTVHQTTQIINQQNWEASFSINFTASPLEKTATSDDYCCHKWSIGLTFVQICAEGLGRDKYPANANEFQSIITVWCQTLKVVNASSVGVLNFTVSDRQEGKYGIMGKKSDKIHTERK